MGDHEVEQALQCLEHAAGSLTLEQRLRIAVLLARPAEPPAARNNAAPHPTAAEPPLLTVEETADLLRVGRTTVYDLMRTGRLASITIGRLRRVRRTDVAAYLAALVDPDDPAGDVLRR